MPMHTILVIINSRKNLLLLEEFLATNYRILIGKSHLESGAYDLLVIDGPSLRQNRRVIEEIRRKSPGSFRPVLFVTHRKDVGFATQLLWNTIDEIITTPIAKVELWARIEMLIRVRSLSLEYNRLLVRYSPLGIIVLDEAGAILQWNPACQELMGWTEDEAQGSVFPFLYERDVPFMQQLLQRVFNGETIFDFQMEFKRKGGTPIFVSLNATSFSRNEEGAAALFIIEDIHERIEYEAQISRQAKQIEKAYDDTILSLSETMDLRDRETAGHSSRVTYYSVEIARRMNLSEDQLVHLRRGALLHDFGKIGIPDAILNKPGPLTEEEWAVMRQHPELAYRKLSHIEYLRPALDVPYCHHERWDGNGYPQGLKGKEIPIFARIFAVSDVYDALTSDRPYRAAWTKEKAVQYIQEQAGAMFDPEVVDIFMHIIRQEGVP